MPKKTNPKADSKKNTEEKKTKNSFGKKSIYKAKPTIKKSFSKSSSAKSKKKINVKLKDIDKNNISISDKKDIQIESTEQTNNLKKDQDYTDLKFKIDSSGNKSTNFSDGFEDSFKDGGEKKEEKPKDKGFVNPLKAMKEAESKKTKESQSVGFEDPFMTKPEEKTDEKKEEISMDDMKESKDESQKSEEKEKVKENNVGFEDPFMTKSNEKEEKPKDRGFVNPLKAMKEAESKKPEKSQNVGFEDPFMIKPEEKKEEKKEETSMDYVKEAKIESKKTKEEEKSKEKSVGFEDPFMTKPEEKKEEKTEETSMDYLKEPKVEGQKSEDKEKSKEKSVGFEDPFMIKTEEKPKDKGFVNPLKTMKEVETKDEGKTSVDFMKESKVENSKTKEEDNLKEKNVGFEDPFMTQSVETAKQEVFDPKKDTEFFKKYEGDVSKDSNKEVRYDKVLEKKDGKFVNPFDESEDKPKVENSKTKEEDKLKEKSVGFEDPFMTKPQETKEEGSKDIGFVNPLKAMKEAETDEKNEERSMDDMKESKDESQKSEEEEKSKEKSVGFEDPFMTKSEENTDEKEKETSMNYMKGSKVENKKTKEEEKSKDKGFVNPLKAMKEDKKEDKKESSLNYMYKAKDKDSKFKIEDQNKKENTNDMDVEKHTDSKTEDTKGLTAEQKKFTEIHTKDIKKEKSELDKEQKDEDYIQYESKGIGIVGGIIKLIFVGVIIYLIYFAYISFFSKQNDSTKDNGQIITQMTGQQDDGILNQNDSVVVIPDFNDEQEQILKDKIITKKVSVDESLVKNLEMTISYGNLLIDDDGLGYINKGKPITVTVNLKNTGEVILKGIKLELELFSDKLGSSYNYTSQIVDILGIGQEESVKLWLVPTEIGGHDLVGTIFVENATEISSMIDQQFSVIDSKIYYDYRIIVAEMFGVDENIVIDFEFINNGNTSDYIFEVYTNNNGRNDFTWFISQKNEIKNFTRKRVTKTYMNRRIDYDTYDDKLGMGEKINFKFELENEDKILYLKVIPKSNMQKSETITLYAK